MSAGMWVFIVWVTCSLALAVGIVWAVLEEGRLTVWDLVAYTLSVLCGPVTIVGLAVVVLYDARNKVLWSQNGGRQAE